MCRYAFTVGGGFRKEKWSSVKLPSNQGTRAAAVVEKPDQGYRAFLVEAELKTANGQIYRLSTEARVVPDSAPTNRAGLKP